MRTLRALAEAVLMSNDETQPVDQPVSGSRWESAERPPATPPSPVTTPDEGSPVAYAPAPPPRQPGRNRGRLLLAGGAVGIALVAGTGGFALGHASADEGSEGHGRFGRPATGGGFPGNGREDGSRGTFPGQGQQPPNGFPDPRAGNDDQQLPDDDLSPGSSAS